MSSEHLSTKQSIRRLEIPINKFNDVAIPHHLDLLHRHKENIKKFESLKDWDKVQKEQINAGRIVKQLEQLLYEMDTLRAQVDNNDIEKFDKLTTKSRENTINAIRAYLDMKFEPPSLPMLSPELSNDDDEKQLTINPLDEHFIQIHQALDDVQRQEACLHAWNALKRDLQQLHQLFIDFNKLIHDQKEQVDKIETDVNESNENVQEGSNYLRKATHLKIGTYPLVGALIGTCLGGPVGLIAGLKFGGLTAFGCGVLGFTGATILKKKHLKSLEETDKQQIRTKSNININSEGIQNNLTIESKKQL